jgi:hypothetical protein
MSVTLQFDTVVLPGNRVEVRSPELPEGQLAKVTIVVDQPSLVKRPLEEILAGYKGGQFKTAEEVDAYIREERESWDK